MYLLPVVTLGIFVTVVAGTEGEHNNYRVSGSSKVFGRTPKLFHYNDYT